MSRSRARGWLIALVAVGLAASVAAPADAGPARRGAAAKPAPKRSTRAKPARKSKAKPARKGKAVAKKKSSRKATPARKTARRKSSRKTSRPPAAAKVVIGSALRPPGEVTGRHEGELTRAEQAAEEIEKVLRGPLRWGTTGLYVVDAQSGRELFAVHPDDPLNPASNVKLISTATALDLLGPDFRYATRVLGPTPDADGVVAGDLYLHGSYDPTLSADHVGELARELAAAGVHQVDGDVVVGSTSTRDGIFRARVKVEVSGGRPGAAPTVTVTPATDFVVIDNQATTSKRRRARPGVSGAVSADGDQPARLHVKVTGAIGKGKSVSRWVWIKERHLHTAHLLRAALAREGVTVKGDVRVAELPDYVDAEAERGRLPVVLARHRSAPLADIVSRVNKRSINWLADRVVNTAAALTADQTPSMGRGLDAMYGWLDRAAGIERDQLLVDTGSGLSYRTQFSPRQIVSVIRAAAGMSPRPATDADRVSACAEAWTGSLAVAGVDGTLRHRFRRSDLRGRIHGKTGTLSRAIALSGVLEGADGRRVVFSLVTNGTTRVHKTAVRHAHEEILEILDDYLADVAAASPGPVTAPEPGPVAAGAAPDQPVSDPADTDDPADHELADDVDEDGHDDPGAGDDEPGASPAPATVGGDGGGDQPAAIPAP